MNPPNAKQVFHVLVFLLCAALLFDLVYDEMKISKWNVKMQLQANHSNIYHEGVSVTSSNVLSSTASSSLPYSQNETESQNRSFLLNQETTTEYSLSNRIRDDSAPSPSLMTHSENETNESQNNGFPFVQRTSAYISPRNNKKEKEFASLNTIVNTPSYQLLTHHQNETVTHNIGLVVDHRTSPYFTPRNRKRDEK